MTGSNQEHTNNCHSTIKCALLIMLAAIGLPYGLSTIQYSMSIQNTSTTPWFDYLFSSLTSTHFQEYDSAHIVQIAFYHENSKYISSHVAAGGLWMICGLLQFINRFRNDKYYLIHRINGWFISICIIISLIGSGGILLIGDAQLNSFSGPIFKWILIIYWIGGFISLLFGLYFIIFNQNIIIHRQFMILSYSLSIGAAFLRVFWCVIYWYDHDDNSTQQNNNIPSIFYTVFLLVIGCYFSISCGDDMNKRNLRRFIVAIDNKSKAINNNSSGTGNNNSKNSINSNRNTETDYSTKVKASTTSRQLGIIGVFFGIFTIQVIFGGYYISDMIFSSYKNIWFDSRDSDDGDYNVIALRVLHWSSWMIVSLFVLCLCFVVVVMRKQSIKFKLNHEKQIKKYEKRIDRIVFGLIVSVFICGVITLMYVSTFKNNSNRFVNHGLSVYCLLRVIIVWIFVGLFVYNYYVKCNFDTSFDAMIYAMWNVNCFPLIAILTIILKWFDITSTKNELFVSSICVETEISFFLSVMTVALLSDMSKNVENRNVAIGRARWPWNININGLSSIGKLKGKTKAKARKKMD